MDRINSITKGIYLFKNDKSIKELRKKPAQLVVSERQRRNGYQLFCKSWKRVEAQIEKLQSNSYENILKSLLGFLRSIKFESENLQTAILLTGVNQTDHLQQFQTLSLQISNNCSSSVIILQSRDCQNIKSAIEMLVSGFINQLDDDEYFPRTKKRNKQMTMAVLEAWYRKHFPSKKTKLVIMIADFEQFNSSCMQELISIICCYTNRLPFVLFAGVATTFKSIHNVLPSHITNKMDVNVFQSESSTVMLNMILEEVVLTHRSPFQLSGKSFQILMDVFLFYDFSLHSFIKGYKMFMLEHFSKYPFDTTLDKEDEIEEEILGWSADNCNDIRKSCDSFRKLVNSEKSPQKRIDLIKSNDALQMRMTKQIPKMKMYLLNFHCSLRILAVLLEDLPQNDLGCLLRELYPVFIANEITEVEEFEKSFGLLRFTSKEKFLSKLEKILGILQSYLNDETIKSKEVKNNLKLLENFYSLISKSGMNSMEISEASSSSPKPEVSNKGVIGRQAMLDQLKSSAKSKQSHRLTEYEQRLYECLDCLRNFIITNMRPVQAAPAFNELFVFKDFRAMRDKIVGAPRGVLHNALNNPQRILQCSCCIPLQGEQILPTYPDASIGYLLHRENNKFINLYDWLQAFASVINANKDDEEISPETQARFTRFVSELQFLGYIKPAKQKADHVVRLTW